MDVQLMLLVEQEILNFILAKLSPNSVEAVCLPMLKQHCLKVIDLYAHDRTGHLAQLTANSKSSMKEMKTFVFDALEQVATEMEKKLFSSNPLGWFS